MLNMSPDGTTWIMTMIVAGIVAAIAFLFLLIAHIATEIAKTRQARWTAQTALHNRDKAAHEAMQAKSKQVVANRGVQDA